MKTLPYEALFLAYVPLNNPWAEKNLIGLKFHSMRYLKNKAYFVKKKAKCKDNVNEYFDKFILIAMKCKI